MKYIIIDNDNNPWGPFDTAVAADNWAKAKWPNETWTVAALLSVTPHL